MVIAQRIFSHCQPGLSCSLSEFGIEITVVTNIYTDMQYICINIRIYTYIYIYTVYTTLDLHWAFPSVDVLLILLRVSARFGAECAFT